jgi:tetratricopeptide (TPR) repeat protein
MAWLELAALTTDPIEQREALDRAVARAPTLDLARWKRFEARVRAGDLRGVREDAGHLEAQARGSFARHEVARKVASGLWRQGLTEQATEWYERALRYVPDSAEAVAGLARSLQAVGRRRRALDLLGRAAALAARASRPAHAVVLDLARALVEVADDRPAAIAHVRQVPPFVAETFEARTLEARWRAELGDLAGADVALGRLADAVEHAQAVLLQEPAADKGTYGPLWGEDAVWPTPIDARAAIAALLGEGARIQQLDRRDLRAARRLVELGMRLLPQDGRLRANYRKLCAELQERDAPIAPVQRSPTSPHPDVRRRGTPAPPPTPSERSSAAETAASTAAAARPRGDEADRPSDPASSEPDVSAPAAAPSRPLVDPSLMASLEGDADSADADDELLIEQLTERLRANPADLDTVTELIRLLERARRDHDLLALLSAQIDDGAEATRPEFVSRRRVVLERLLVSARQAGSDGEAELYALMLERSGH